MLNGLNGDKIMLSKFAANAEPEQREVSTRVDDVIRAIVALGGTYPDVVQALQQAKVDGSITSRFEVDALPQSGRRFDRLAHPSSHQRDDEIAQTGHEDTALEVATPLPDLFGRPR